MTQEQYNILTITDKYPMDFTHEKENISSYSVLKIKIYDYNRGWLMMEKWTVDIEDSGFQESPRVRLCADVRDKLSIFHCPYCPLSK